MPSFINRSEQNVVEELLELSNVGPFGGVQSEVPLDQIEQFGQIDVVNMTLRKSVAETRSGYTILPAYPGATAFAGSRIFVNSQTGASETYVEAPANAVYNSLATGTIACWVYQTNHGSIAYLVTKDPAGVGTPNFNINVGGALEGQVALTGPAYIDSISNETVPLNTWTHVLMTWDLTGTGRVLLYINGVQCTYAGFSFGTGTPANDSSGDFYFGNNTTDNGLTGRMSEVAIWSTVLSGANITSLAASTTGAASISPGSLVGYWHLCGTSSPEPDSSGNGDNGIVNGTPPPATGPSSPGYAGCTITPINEDTTGIADFYDNAATRIQVVMTLTRLIKWDSSTQDWVTIPGPALTGGPFDLFTWTVVNDELCFCQGIDPIMLWDGISGTFGPAAPGVITSASVDVGGSGFVVGDTFTIPGGNGFASFTVLTVDGSGAVLTFAITNPGVGYATGTGIVATATSGVGIDLTIDVLTVETASFPAKYLMELGTHLVTAYTIEGGTPHTQRVRWSGAGDPTDFTSPSSGVNDILGDLGPITGAVKIFQTGYIFHQWGVTQMIPTGVGTNPFQFVPLTTRARGNTVPYSLAAAGEEYACYVGKDNVYIFNGTNSEPIGDKPVANNKRLGARSRIFKDLANSDPRSVVGYVSDTINGQVFPAYWLMMPQGAMTVIWIYNLDEQNWARFTFTGAISTLGRFFGDMFTRWEDLVGTWADQTLDWDQFPGINPFDTILLAFNNGVDGNFDFNSVSEQNWSMSGVFVMGDIRHSKTIQKFRVCILDNGPVTFTVALSNASGQVVSQTVTMGSSSGKNISQVLTLKINGIRINWSITGVAGQDVTLVEFAPMYGIAGEQRGGSIDA